jgi:purine-binding chemotaxis protein CheW
VSAPLFADSDAARRTLEERAVSLARPPKVEDRAELVGVLVLAVGSERYAVVLDHVIGIAPLPEVTALSGAPGFWLGIANVRGTVYPILQLREYLRLPPSPSAGGADELVLVAAAGLSVGLICDGVSEVSWIRQDDIQPPPTPAPGSRASLLGVTSDPVAVLDLELVLRDQALVVNDDVS